MKMTGVKELMIGLRDAIAPARCISCLQENTWHCFDCRDNMRYADLSCLICKTKHPRGLTCRDCLRQTPITGALTVDSYHAMHLRRGIHWLKFKNIRAVAPVLARLLTSRLTIIAPIQHLRDQAVLVPIPLHRRRARQRGFNQSEDIARAISEQTGIPVRSLLIRQRATYAQAKLPNGLRARNASNAFASLPLAAREDLNRIRYFILIDDVATSGATLTAAGQALHGAFPNQTIWAATIARG